jgi:hypothetical protein
MARSHLLWLMLAIVTPSGVTAQVVRGTVRADSTGNPIAGADVWLQGTLSRVRTDRTGRYRVAALKPDSYHLVVRAVGFRPLEIDAVLAAADSIETDLVLTPLAIELAPLEVSAAAPPRLSARMRGFEEHGSSLA